MSRPTASRLARLRACLALGVGAGFAGCGRHSPGEEAGSAPGQARVPVELATVVRDSLVETLGLTGRLAAKPGGSALLTAPAAGVVRTVRAQIGDRVRPGVILAELEVPELAADAGQRAAQAAQAAREAARQQRLLADGITSARQAEEAALGARQTAAAASAARKLLARTGVASPIAGRVQSVLVQPGERAEAGRPLIQIVSTDTLDLMATVPAASLGAMSVGDPAVVRQDGDSVPAPGRVAAIAPGVDSLTNAGAVVIRVPNPDGRLRPGAGATARVTTAVRHDVLTVPDSALVLAGDRTVVFVVGADSVARQRIVQRGGRAGNRTEVRGPLQAGDEVVTVGAFGLQDGMLVVPPRVAPTGGPGR